MRAHCESIAFIVLDGAECAVVVDELSLTAATRGGDYFLVKYAFSLSSVCLSSVTYGVAKFSMPRVSPTQPVVI